MADGDFLSQEEIDALLGGDDEVEEREEDVEEIRPFDFTELESIKKGGLPGLDLIYERWVKVFREEIRKVLPKINMVNKEAIYISRFNNFMYKIPMPSSYTTFTMKPLKETALLVVDSRLVFTIISVMFGGPAKPFKVEGREFTKLETYVIKDFIDIALKTLEETFSTVYEITIEKKSTELNPALARITSGNEKVIICESLIDIDGFEAPIYFCFPNGMFLPIKDVIYSDFSGEVDPQWEERLQELLMETPVRVSLELTRKRFFMRQILAWDVGSEILLDVSREDPATLKVEDEPKFNCRLGKVKDRYAALLKEEVVREEEEGE
ncbi:MAG: flagellar motor switch protein FliM [Epsilonproteobacteria bacterium]|nr:flagellar motor switch protein FliM [Campylobacterota bacterium]NPA57379.1 flagellar motor switch protein FliM [Campylobacterota bacterium]